MRIASETRKAYYGALVAEESVRYAQQVNQVAQVSADLARRMRDVGNFSKLQHAREQGFYADAILNLARAERRGSLCRSGYPICPKRPTSCPMSSRPQEQCIDLQMVRLETEALASNLGLTRATRFINVFEAGFARER